MTTLRPQPRIYSIIFALVAGTICACGGAPETRRYNRQQAQESLKKLEKPGLLIGDFRLARDAILDGDTVRVEGLQSTLRLLGIDTEETFKNDTDRRKADDFEKYLRDKRGDKRRPQKAATPVGEEAKKWAKKFFAGVQTVRLERDHPKEIRGVFKRYLAYVLVNKNGVWLNYNVECVRAGMTPYFTKYGYSRRFHKEFLEAEKQARAKQLGVWDPSKQHYRDYPERLKWWNMRADFIRQFEQDAQQHNNYIPLTNWDSLRRLEERFEQEAVVLATVGRVIIGDKGPTRVMLSRQRNADFPLIFWDNDAFGSSGIADHQGEFVIARGVVKKYKGRLQMVINTPGQITLSPVPGHDQPSASTPANTNEAEK